MKTMDEIKGLIREKEQTKAAIDKEIVKLKIELAELVLSSENAEESTKEAKGSTIVSVCFKTGGKTYDYIWDSEEAVKVGDMVRVEGRWNGWTEVEVVAVFEGLSLYERDYKCAYPAE